MKIALTDLETTGLDATKHEILEIGCVVFDSETGDIHDQLSVRVKPARIETAEPAALAKNGYTEEGWKNAIPLVEAIGRFRSITEGAIFCSFPLLFDWGFLAAADGVSQLDRYKLDLLSLAWMKTGYIMSLKKYCILLRVPEEPDVHRAIAGAMCGYEVFKKVTEKEPVGV